jgi:protein-S-isoprenylcysteine O-methyltransferase Ste14
MSETSASESRRRRRVEPVPEDAAPDVFDPRSTARRGLAVWLALGPVIASLGFLGWLRIVAGLDTAAPGRTSLLALLIDLVLALQFALSHSLLARGFGRRLLNRPFGPAAERPLYVFISGLSLCLLVLAWQPTGPALWTWSGWMRPFSWILQVGGLTLVAWGGFVVGSAQLLGLPHLKALETGGREPQAEFTALPPYSVMRQPINLGFLLLLAGMPEVRSDHLILGVVFAAWILIAAPIEERDLEIEYDGYASYCERTPRWFPRLRSRES